MDEQFSSSGHAREMPGAMILPRLMVMIFWAEGHFVGVIDLGIFFQCLNYIAAKHKISCMYNTHYFYQHSHTFPEIIRKLNSKSLRSLSYTTA